MTELDAVALRCDDRIGRPFVWHVDILNGGRRAGRPGDQSRACLGVFQVLVGTNHVTSGHSCIVRQFGPFHELRSRLGIGPSPGTVVAIQRLIAAQYGKSPSTHNGGAAVVKRCLTTRADELVSRTYKLGATDES